MQAYIQETPWKLGSRRTSRLMSLYIYNTSLYEDQGVLARRDSEVTSALAQVGGTSLPTNTC